MKNLENYGVFELTQSSSKLMQGGSWLGKSLGKLLGAAAKYSTPYGGSQFLVDYTISKM